MERPRTTVFCAVSIDGFIARPDGSVDWLEVEGADGEHGYAELMATVDVLLLGKKTFEWVLGYGGPWPYEDVRVVVASRTLTAVVLPEELRDRVSVIGGAPAEILARLTAEGAGHVYVDGGLLVQDFLRAGLIDEMTLTRIPVLLGAGRPLFGDLPADVALEHVGTTTYRGGLVQSRYRVRR